MGTKVIKPKLKNAVPNPLIWTVLFCPILVTHLLVPIITMDDYVENSRIGRDLLTLRKLYIDLENLRNVQGKTRQRNSIKARIEELSRNLPRFLPSQPNPIPLPLQMVNQLLETYGLYATDATPTLRRPTQPRTQNQNRNQKVPAGFVRFNIGEERKKLVGKVVRVNDNGHRYRGVVTGLTISGAEVQSNIDNRIRIVHPSKLTIIGSAFEPDTVPSAPSADYFERATPAFTAPTPAGFVESREDEMEERGHSRFTNLENTIQDLLVLLKRVSGYRFPFPSTITQAVLPEFTVAQTNLKISYNRTPTLYKALASAFLHLYLEPRIEQTIDIPRLVSSYIPSVEKNGKSVSSSVIVEKFIELLRAKYSVDFPIVDTQTISYIGRAKSRKYVTTRNLLTDQTARMETRLSSTIPPNMQFGPSLGTANSNEPLFALSSKEENELQFLESREEELVDRLRAKQSDPLHGQIHRLKTSENPSSLNTTINRINIRLDEIANELVLFSQERERKLSIEIRKNPLRDDHDPEDSPEYIRTKRNLLYKEKARLMAKRTAEMKKFKNTTDSMDNKIEALLEERRQATTKAQKDIINKQLREAKRVKAPDSLVDEQISQLEAQLVRKYGNPEIMLTHLQKLRNLRELRAKAGETMAGLFD